MKVIRTIEKEINRCFLECPFYGTEDGHVMICEHPEAPENGFIISHPECDRGFPKECPLRQE